MSLSMYDASIPVLIRGLAIMSHYLDKAAAYAIEKNIPVSVLLQARLAPDMLPLAGQVQRASDNAKGGAARLAGITGPNFADTETTLEELQERVAKTVAFLETITPEQLEGSESRSNELRFRSINGVMRGDVYLLSFLLPNFFFHITTAHDILRHNGCQLNKRDYIGSDSLSYVNPPVTSFFGWHPAGTATLK
ncbi:MULTISPECIES: DUF1993 family protein [unclassified Janthinobacterium]|uniref:DUF1993 domain-containing protein n=1 Tax=unclassified Janthinobacterium TaxID=2610881 RepID=UPI00160A1B9D|nr:MULTISPECIES: DUF1993 domain-containing protein [unclassified Janthinobacterium]MBB5371650.1 hypothetical protein [Janthinobacterium sp. K2C7]MBB5384455.1 hypothetical protein [Janthinobacterium sp. K2Li3]MBB5389731.1 hypothetical protein [Janthinobacterium sp. K2E3]